MSVQWALHAAPDLHVDCPCLISFWAQLQGVDASRCQRTQGLALRRKLFEQTRLWGGGFVWFARK